MRVERVYLGRVLVGIEKGIPAAENHLPDIIHAMACHVHLSILLLDQLSTYDVDAAQLVHHGDHEWLMVGAYIDEAVAGNES